MLIVFDERLKVLSQWFKK